MDYRQSLCGHPWFVGSVVQGLRRAGPTLPHLQLQHSGELASPIASCIIGCTNQGSAGELTLVAQAWWLGAGELVS